MGKPEAELFEIELDGIEKEIDVDMNGEVYDVSFDCMGLGRNLHATVGIGVKDVSTLEIVPRAMSELHRMLADLAEQTKAWLIKKPSGAG